MKTYFILLWIAHLFLTGSAQVAIFPYRESFDTAKVPALPSGWISSNKKNPGGDFISSATSPRTPPHALSSTDATRPQFVILPEMNFSGKSVDTLEFFERRTSTHLARVLVEAAIGNDSLFGIRISVDSLRFISASTYVRRVFSLPETLSGKASVRIRIRTAGDSSGGTGVYRIDDVRLTVKKQIDLSLSSSVLTPLNPKEGDLLTLSAWMKNGAAAGTFSGIIRLYDSLILITTKTFSHSFSKDDSLMIQLEYPSITAGRHSLRIEVRCEGDEDTTNNSLALVVNAGSRPGMLLINEFMYLPITGMPEWIEIFNPGPKPIPLSGWKISDGGTTKAPLLPSGRIMDGYSYAVITTDTNALKNFYDVTVPLFHAPFSSLNNSGDAVVLFDQTNSMIDSLSYLPFWGGSPGRSLERIDTSIISTAQLNWRTSQHPAGSTPGSVNSVTPKEFDITVTHIMTTPFNPISGEESDAAVTIRNIGKKSVRDISVRLYRDINADSLVTATEMTHEKMIPALDPNDSLIIHFVLPALPQGSHRIAASVSAQTDDNHFNDLFMMMLTVRSKPRSVVINEVMYAPGSDIPEWIEGYNRSEDSVVLSGWKVSDNGSTKAVITGNRIMIAPQSYFIITPDTIQFLTYYPSQGPIFQASFSGLNNTTPDAAVLYDERGVQMDSLFYRPAWGGSDGTSLQRFDTESSSMDSLHWKSGVPDPWIENRSARKGFDAEIRNVSVDKFSGGISIRLAVFNGGRHTINGAVLRLYHDKLNDGIHDGDEIIFFNQITSLLPNDSAHFVFDWQTALHGKQNLIAVCEFSSDERLSNNTGSGSVAFEFSIHSLIVNEIMYEPLAGGNEFVEILNRSTDTIDVSGWKLMDQPGTSGSRTVILLSDSSLRIPPNGYLAVASDSSFFGQFPDAVRKWTVIAPSLSLNNSGEDLILCDLTGAQIDSVHYSPQWHLKNVSTEGRSLERINPALGSNDIKNWSSSVAWNLATPLFSNSIFTPATATHSSISLSPNPFSPDQDGHEDFISINYSLPSTSSSIRIRIFDVTGRLIRRLVQGEPSVSTGTALWNGLDDEGHQVRIGMYIILLEALDNFGGAVRTMKDVAVVAGRL